MGFYGDNIMFVYIILQNNLNTIDGVYVENEIQMVTDTSTDSRRQNN